MPRLRQCRTKGDMHPSIRIILNNALRQIGAPPQAGETPDLKRLASSCDSPYRYWPFLASPTQYDPPILAPRRPTHSRGNTREPLRNPAKSAQIAVTREPTRSEGKPLRRWTSSLGDS